MVGRLLCVDAHRRGAVRARPLRARRRCANAVLTSCVVARLSRGWRCVRRPRPCPRSMSTSDAPGLLTGALAALALLNLLAVVGFGKRFYERREDLDRWLALGVDADAVRVAALRLHADGGDRGRSRAATSCACSPTGCCSSAPGARSATQSSGAPSRRSVRASRARSTMGSRSTCSPSRRTRRCFSTAPRSRRRSRS